MKRIGVFICLGILTFILIWSGLFSHPAASQQIESRLNNLEADFNRLQSEVNQLQSQLSNRPSSSPRTTITPSPSRRNLSQKEKDKMFDRLATLVVEVKRQVQGLEKRVTKLESR
jgi:type II secretory pathway component PulM